MQNLYNAYLQDFKNIWGKRKEATATEIVYHSNYRVTGSIDRTNFVIYNRLDRTFAFTAVMDSNFVKAAALNEAFKQIQLPVGKVKMVDQTLPALSAYEVADRDTAPFKAKRLMIIVTNAADNLCMENGRHFSFKIIPVVGNEDK
ncbi:MAG TPA: hypothetical protein VF622_11835 [Segetibacter sp.]